MKKIICISAMILALANIVGCSSKQDSLLGSPSDRMNAEMDKALKTLLGAENGWYLAFFQGWSSEQETGGYWYLCDFNEDSPGIYTVTGALELDLEGNAAYPKGTSATSSFAITQGSVVELTVNEYNPVMHYFCLPDSQYPNGRFGDPMFTYQFISISDDYIKLRGVRTEKYLHLYRRDDSKTMLQAMTDIAAVTNVIDKATIQSVSFMDYTQTGYATGVPAGGVNESNNVRPITWENAPSSPNYGKPGSTFIISKVNRTFVFNYSYYDYNKPRKDDSGNVVVDVEGNPLPSEIRVTDKIVSFIPSRDGMSLDLSSPIELYTQDNELLKITSFRITSETSSGFVLESDDDNVSVVINFKFN